MKKQKTGYHWLIVAACFLLMAVSVGILINCFGPLVPRLIEYFNTDESSIQLIFSIAVLANLLGGAVAGKIMSKVRMSLVMPIYAVLMSGGILGWSYSTELWHMYLVSLCIGIGASGVSLVPCGILINNWFKEKKGVATGIAFTGSVAGGLLFVQLTSYLVSNDFIITAGWQQAYRVLGIIAAVISIPVTIFIIKGSPQEKGLYPYGAENHDESVKIEITGISLKKFISTTSFKLLALSVFIIGFVNLGVQNNIQVYYEGLGYTMIVASMVFSINLLVQIFGKFILGWLYDKKGIPFSQIYCLVCFIGCIILLIISRNGNNIFPYIFGALFGLVASMTTVSPPYVTAKIVGLKNYPIIFGILSLFYGIGVASGPLVVAALSATAGWTLIWIVLAVLSAVMAFTMILAFKKGDGFDLLKD